MSLLRNADYRLSSRAVSVTAREERNVDLMSCDWTHDRADIFGSFCGSVIHCVPRTADRHTARSGRHA
ncbi:unnamed protein product [Staurois parvus]|uniref:Uncharacterized protein n=1 Tax=Staurois parvus TaxID=386267 RepID=A0ABN9BJE8_9NEOB|nr:unnamed protein product [Staurois parvus]